VPSALIDLPTLIGMIAVTAAFGGLPATTAQHDSEDRRSADQIILNAWADPATCNDADPKPVSVEEIITRSRRLNGICVSVDGFWVSRALFDRARSGNRNRSNVDPRLRFHRIGIYARSDVLERAPSRAERYIVTGIVGQCDTEWPEAMMVMGYCHYTGGPILRVSGVRPASAIARRTAP
jgi:hypothetical protein